MAIIPLVLFSVSAGSVHAFTVPPWVYKALFRIAVWGANTLANNVNLNVLDEPKVTPWKVEIGSIKFNNRSLNTGHIVGYKTKIATTWHQSWTRTHVAMLATKRSFTSGSKYIVPEVVTPDGIVDLERMRSGNYRFYEAYGNTPDIGDHDFRFIYHDSETWDISLTFNDVFRPDIPI